MPPPATPGFLSQGAALRTPLFALWMDVSSLGKRSAPFLMVSRRGRRSASDVLVARRVFSQLSRSSRQYTTLRPKRRNGGEPPQQRILASVAGARPRSRAASRVFNFSSVLAIISPMVPACIDCAGRCSGEFRWDQRELKLGAISICAAIRFPRGTRAAPRIGLRFLDSLLSGAVKLAFGQAGKFRPRFLP